MNDGIFEHYTSGFLALPTLREFLYSQLTPGLFIQTLTSPLSELEWQCRVSLDISIGCPTITALIMRWELTHHAFTKSSTLPRLPCLLVDQM